MSSVLQLSLDGKRFHGRWDDAIEHCLSSSEFNAELRRINAEWSRRYHRGQSWSAMAYALPFICIPLGIVLIALSAQSLQWPYLTAGIVLGVSGLLSGVMFRSVLGLALTVCGLSLAAVPYASDSVYVFVVIGAVQGVLGIVGLFAFAVRDNVRWRSCRVLVIMIPIAISFMLIPAGGVQYQTALIFVGVSLILAGVLAAVDAMAYKQRRFDKCARDLRLVVEQLNMRYLNKVMWTLIEKQGDAGNKTILEIVIEADPSCAKNEKVAVVVEQVPVAVVPAPQAPPAVFNVTINNQNQGTMPASTPVNDQAAESEDQLENSPV